MRLEEAAWAEVRRLYAEGSEPLTAIAGRFGIARATLTNRAKREAWPSRARAAAAKTATAQGITKRKVEQLQLASPKASASKSCNQATKTSSIALPSRRTQRAVVGRLYRAISLKLELMERRMANGEERSAQDEERESRALGTMIRNFEKVTEAVSDFDQTRERSASDAPADRADAERMRREIAQRLERLHAQGETGGGSREP
ncbi:MAG: helix-turn-helix domain-containing protein [Hyphomicrobium sp.]|jgi:hypothetical protein